MSHILPLAAAILAPFALLFAYLAWQATIRPAPYDVMFEVREPSPLRVIRSKDGWRLRAQGIAPVALRVGVSPTALGEPVPLSAHGGTYTAPGPHPYPRAFFAIEMADGSSIATAERILPLEGSANFRDAGGYPTADGRRIAWGRIYRADELYQLTPADWERIRALGVRVVCDLRSPDETTHRPDCVPDGIAYRALPVYIDNPIGRLGVLLGRHRLDVSFRRLYRQTIIDAGAPVLGELLRLIAEPANLPLVFHCTGGKDRTGVAAALLLHICGVDRGTIIADYSLTNLATQRTLATLEEVLEDRGPRLGIRVNQLYPLMSARPALIEEAFAHIEATYGSVDAYLRGPVGLTEQDIAEIRAAMLEA